MLVSYIYNRESHRMEKVYSCKNPMETAIAGRARETFGGPTRIVNRY